jgi:hypothetical protein
MKPREIPAGYYEAGKDDCLVVLKDGSTMPIMAYIEYLEAALDDVRSQLRALRK